jgi:hypothetical protein
MSAEIWLGWSHHFLESHWNCPMTYSWWLAIEFVSWYEGSSSTVHSGPTCINIILHSASGPRGIIPDKHHEIEQTVCTTRLKNLFNLVVNNLVVQKCRLWQLQLASFYCKKYLANDLTFHDNLKHRKEYVIFYRIWIVDWDGGLTRGPDASEASNLAEIPQSWWLHTLQRESRCNCTCESFSHAPFGLLTWQ